MTDGPCSVPWPAWPRVIPVIGLIIALLSFASGAHAVATAAPAGSSLTAPRMPIGAEALQARPVAARSPAEVAAQQGFELLLGGDLPAAKLQFDRALGADPASIAALLGLADVAMRERRTADAASYLERARSLDPRNPYVESAFGRLYASQGQVEPAMTAYRKAIALDPSVLLPYLDMADLELGVRRDPVAAATHYRKALELQPTYTPARFGLGMALLAAGDKAAAIEEFRKVAKAAPDDPAPWQLIGRIHASEQRYPDAVKALDEALGIDPSFRPAVVDRADVYSEMNRDADAARDYRRALELQPGDAISQMKLGMIEQRSGRPKQAIAAYRAALKLDPNLAPACNNLAMLALANGGDLDEALTLASRAVKLSPTVPQFHDTLGWVYRARGDRTRALESLRKATSLPPPQAEIWFRLGQVEEEAGRPAEALAAYRKALEIDAGFPDAAVARARIAALGG